MWWSKINYGIFFPPPKLIPSKKAKLGTLTAESDVLSRIKYFYPSDAFWPPLRQIHLPHLPSIQTIIIGRCLRFGRAFSLFVLLKLRFPSLFFGWMEQLMIIFVYLLLAEFCFFYFFFSISQQNTFYKAYKIKGKKFFTLYPILCSELNHHCSAKKCKTCIPHKFEYL